MEPATDLSDLVYRLCRIDHPAADTAADLVAEAVMLATEIRSETGDDLTLIPLLLDLFTGEP